MALSQLVVGNFTNQLFNSSRVGANYIYIPWVSPRAIDVKPLRG